MFAVASFSYILASGVGEQGAMFVLLCETLVPWGFLLFYFKLCRLRAHPAFRYVTLGGLTTLGARVAIFSFLIYRLWWVEWERVPSASLWLGWLFVMQLGLDAHWIRLYLSNFKAHRRAIAELNGAPYPSIWSAFTAKPKPN